jgi:hypothetical protein
MTKGQKTRSKAKTSPQIENESILDTFSAEDIERWTKNAAGATHCALAVHFDLERQRVNNRSQLIEALQSTEPVVIDLNHWIRVVDYQWSLQPLSSEGSIRGIGGRFNYGAELSAVRRQEFPCLYLASDKTTAYCEKFGGQPDQKLAGLSRQEYALRNVTTSFTTFDVTGQVHQVFDLRTTRGIESFANVISRFTLSKSTKDRYTKFNLKTPSLIRDAKGLQKRILASPEKWRLSGNAFGIPAPSQIFGWFLREAGFEGVLYPSQQGGNLCLAVFPENMRASDSVIEVPQPHPIAATCTRMDRNNLWLPPR